MMTEGTYPQSFGGVSVWCDQLVRGLGHHHFEVYAIKTNGNEAPVWELPPNLVVRSIGLWPADNRKPKPRRPHRRDPFAAAYRELIRALLWPWADASARAFEAALRALADGAAADPDQAALAPYHETAAGWLIDEWSADPDLRAVAVPTVLDALTAVDAIERSLRPLLQPAPRVHLTHAVTNGLATLPGLAAKWRYGTPMVLTEHGVYLRERYLGLRAAGYNWPVKATLAAFFRLLCTTAYRSADLVAPGNQYNKRWEVTFGADPDRIETVYNGVAPDDFPPAGTEPDQPTVTWAGRIDPIKDLVTLIRGFALIREELPDARLRIFGGTAAGGEGYRDSCQALAAELGLAASVTFEGRVARIRDAYEAGHVVVLSSISEGFPYTLIEAMTSGRATVSTDVGGVSEAVGDAGLVIPPREPEALAAACLELLRDDARRRDMGRRARQRALANFTVDKAVESYDAIYHDLTTPGVREDTRVLASMGGVR